MTCCVKTKALTGRRNMKMLYKHSNDIYLLHSAVQAQQWETLQLYLVVSNTPISAVLTRKAESQQLPIY